jgi:hypothetical protein
VKVVVEVVSARYFFALFLLFQAPVAFVKGGYHTIREGHATRTPRQDITIVYYGVSCLWHNIVCSAVPYPSLCAIFDAVISFLREGTQAKSHYLICGIQGDFTRKLVSDPPTHLWTRQLKVRFSDTASSHDYSKNAECSLPESRTRLHCTAGVSAFALEQESVQPCLHVSRWVTHSHYILRAKLASDWIPRTQTGKVFLVFSTLLHASI